MSPQGAVNAVIRFMARFYREEEDERATLKREAAARLERLGPGANHITSRPELPDTHVRKTP